MRTFLAVPVEDPVVRRRLEGARSLLPALHGVSWVPRTQLHFTLKFLGEIAPEQVADAGRAAGRAAEAFGARVPGGFRVALEGIGAFPPSGAPRVVWAGCGEGAEALAALAAAVEEAFAAEGFPPEPRPFSAHLTLARVRDPLAGRRLARALPSVAREPFGSVSVSCLVLYRSTLTPRGAEHEEILRVALESPAAPQ